jgi:signal transduction histidine kinase/ActR/RegA family two-component response regulator
VSIQTPSPGLQHSHTCDSLSPEPLRQYDPAGSLSDSQLEAKLTQVLEHLWHLVPYRSAIIQLAEQGVLRIVAQRGLPSFESMAPVAEDKLYRAVVQIGQPVIVSDLQQDPRRPQQVGLEHVRAWIGTPLLASDQAIGLIAVGSDEPDTYDAYDAQVVASFASRAAVIVENACLAQRLSRSEKLFQTLQEVVALVNSSLDSDHVLNEVLKQLERILPYTSASIHLLQANRILYAAGRGFPVNSHPKTKLSAGENTIFQHIAQAKQAMLIEDVRKHPDWHIKPGLGYIRSWIGAPLIFKDQVVGYLTLDHNQVGAYTQQDVQIAETFARQVATAIENARLYTKTRRWAEEQAAINTIATAASSSLNLKKMLNRVLDATQILFEVDAAEVRLASGEDEALHLAVLRSKHVPMGTPSLSDSNGDDTDLARQADHPPVASESHSFAGHADMPGEVAAAVSLRSKGQLLGSLSIISYRERQFTPREISLLEAVGYQLSLAIENARLYERLKESEARKTSLLHELGESLQELQHAQARLVQSEKLAAVGQLVSGVAHELNNPLTAIIGFAQILEASDLPSSAKADLNRIVEQAKRSAHIVQKLLTFSRQHKPHRRLVDVNQLIEETLDLVSNQLTMGQIAVERQLSEDIPRLLADPYQLQQVWLNLIQNAQQAMTGSHGGGVLCIQTLATPAGKIWIEFSDNGPGIAPDVMEKIFDPFFTTKSVGKGTGLGLSICFGIVQEHQGQIWAESNVQGGSTFVVELPGQEDDTGDAYPNAFSLAEASGSAKVLIVDDELPVRELVERYLTHQGYAVEIAQDGSEAMKRIHQDDYDVILLDVIMPQKGGIDTYREIVERRPELGPRVIFATGDVATETTRAFFEETGAGYIAKPFDLAELSRVIQATLESNRSERAR